MPDRWRRPTSVVFATGGHRSGSSFPSREVEILVCCEKSHRVPLGKHWHRGQGPPSEGYDTMLKGLAVPLPPKGQSAFISPKPRQYPNDYVGVELGGDPTVITLSLPPRIGPDAASKGRGLFANFGKQFTASGDGLAPPARAWGGYILAKVRFAGTACTVSSAPQHLSGTARRIIWGSQT